MQKHGDVTIVVPVIDETWSLEETVRVLVDENSVYIKEILIVTAPRTTEDSLRCIASLRNDHPSLIRVHEQTLPYLGGALREAFELARGEFTVMMCSDLETDPHTVRQLIAEITESDCDVVVASRWLPGGGFHQYGFVNTIVNLLFQRTFSFLYGVSLTDLTFGFRIYRTDILKRIRWEELRHPFAFEALGKPLRLGYEVREIPTRWERRHEGRSHNSFWSYYFGYLKAALKVRFSPTDEFLRE